MRVYRFGLCFKSKSELAAILGVPPFAGRPLVGQDPKIKRGYSAYLSESDIINRLRRLGGFDDDAAAIQAFKALVKEYRASQCAEA